MVPVHVEHVLLANMLLSMVLLTVYLVKKANINLRKAKECVVLVQQVSVEYLDHV